MMAWVKTTAVGGSPAGRFRGVGALAALLALLFAACAQERIAGGDDYPNSVETLGKGVAREQNDSSEWNAYKAAPDTAPGLYDSTYVPDTIPRDYGSGSLKPGLLPGEVLPGTSFVPGLDLPGAFRTLDTLVDSLAGTLRAVRVQSVTGLQVRDTTWYRRDSAGAVVILRASGSATRTGGRVDRFSFEDGDGDGVLSPRAGSASLAEIRYSWSSADTTGSRSLRIAAGADGSFNRRGDNRLLAYVNLVKAGSDTLLSILLRDADGDGLLFNPLGDTNLVDVDWITGAGGSSDSQLALHYRLAAFADPSRNHAVRYRAVLETGDGVTETVALGRDSLPDFAPGDTGLVRVTFASVVSADTLEMSRSEYLVLLSDTAGDFGDNRLLRVDKVLAYRLGASTGVRYTLWPTTPVPDGEFARQGSVVIRVDLREGGWIGFSGESTVSGTSGTWMDSQGDTGMVHFDLAGYIIASP